MHPSFTKHSSNRDCDRKPDRAARPITHNEHCVHVVHSEDILVRRNILRMPPYCACNHAALHLHQNQCIALLTPIYKQNLKLQAGGDKSKLKLILSARSQFWKRIPVPQRKEISQCGSGNSQSLPALPVKELDPWSGISEDRLYIYQ